MKRFVSVVGMVLLMSEALPEELTGLATKASNEFGYKLFKLVSEQKKEANVLVCPLSLHLVLALVHQGAGGKTATQLGTVLAFSGANVEDIRQSYKAVLLGVENDTLKIATNLYPAADFQLNKDFLTITQDFQSDIENIDYSNSSEAANTINSYVEEKADNKIHDLVQPDMFTESTRLVVVNAVHFHGLWLKPFLSSYEDYFKVTLQQEVKAQMMTQVDFFEYKEDSHLESKVLKMEYEKKGYSMLFVLPNKEDGLPVLNDKMVNYTLESVLEGLERKHVKVAIPKFKFQQNLQLKDTLIKMGLNDLFSPEADLQKVAEGENFFVSDVIQKTCVKVDEKGTEAAAATAIIGLGSAGPDPERKEFEAVHPFLFFILDGSNTALFIGKLINPVQHK